MHDVGIAFDGMKAFHLHGSKAGDFSQVVAAQIHQHVVFGDFLGVDEKIRFQSFVFFLGLSSGTGSGKGKGMEHAIFQFYQRLRGRAGDFHVGSGKIEHVRGRVHGPQDPVGIEQASLKRRAEPVGQHNLENVSLIDVLLCFFHHSAISVPVKEGRHLAQQPTGGFFFLFSGT